MRSPEQEMGKAPFAEAPSPGRRLLRWLSALVLLSLLAGGGRVLLIWEPYLLPVRVIDVDGELEHLKPKRLQKVVVENLHGGILTQDLFALKKALETLPWVRTVSLSRRWPDRLELGVIEQVAFARWGDDALVCADGVIFRPKVGDFPPGLPRLSGRDVDSLQVVERFLSWGSRLADLGLRIEELTQDARGAWSLRLSTGIVLALGKSQADERLHRFVRAYPTLAAVGLPSLVDMRYSNGLAIRWADSPEKESGHGEGDDTRSAQLQSRPSGRSRS